MVSGRSSSQLLSIGGFAAATQLSPKALRLYDEQRLLQPARIDAASGYRYYRIDQVAAGRLIRTLREMDLSLAEVTRIVGAKGRQAEALLREQAGVVDQRYAREKRAFQAALLLLRGAAPGEAAAIEQGARSSMTVVVRPFLAERRNFYDRVRSELGAAQRDLKRLQLSAADEHYCRLLEPLSDEAAAAELLVPIGAPAQLPAEVTLRRIPAATCAAVAANPAAGQVADFSGPADAIFDWFDRHGHRAVDVPWLHRVRRGADLHTRIIWAFEPADASTR